MAKKPTPRKRKMKSQMRDFMSQRGMTAQKSRRLADKYIKKKPGKK